MPRDGSGNYTLPAGNPVVSGTTIDVAWANPTMSDIATQLNNVVTRDGKLGLTAQSKAIAGGPTTPLYSFSTPAPANSGLYGGSNQVGLALAGAAYVNCQLGVGVQFGGQMLSGTPSLKAGSYTPVAADLSVLLGVTFPTTWYYSGINIYGQLAIVTLVGDFEVEPGGAPQNQFSFTITLPFARSSGDVVGGGGGCVSASGGASVPEIATAYAGDFAATTKILIRGRTPAGFIAGGGRKYRFSVSITYRTNVL